MLITIFNQLGQQVQRINNPYQKPGLHKLIWDGKDEFGRKVESGIYFYQMKTDYFSETKKMLLLQ